VFLQHCEFFGRVFRQYIMETIYFHPGVLTKADLARIRQVNSSNNYSMDYCLA